MTEHNNETPAPGTQEWLDLVVEEIVEPDLAIVDPHHHLWKRAFGGEYLLDNLWQDTQSGHNVVKTVFVECHSQYRKEGPENEKPLGETVFVVDQARQSEAHPDRATIAAIVGHADLMDPGLAEILQAHIELGEARFRGIRHAGARALYPETLFIPGSAIEGLYGREDFRSGVSQLGKMGLTYDTWHYHHQNQAFAELAKACPDTQMILDHFGTPLGVGPFAGKREEIFKQWQADIAEIADCPNVVAKLGGLAMPDNGFGWHERATPPTSDEFCEAQRPYYLHAIHCFGPDRCMMESNFPVDRFSISYPVLYNGLKKIVSDFTASEKAQMFYGTAARVYQLD